MERVRSHGSASSSSSCSCASDLGRRSVAGFARTATLTPVPSRRQQQQQEHHHTPAAAGRDSASLNPSGAPNPRLGGPIRDLSRFRRAWPAVSIKLEEAEPSTSATSTQVPEENIITEFIAETLLPTRHGLFRLRGYKHSADGGVTFTEPTATIAGQVEGKEDVPVRIHDACFTSEVLGSLKCDCAEQLTLALQMIQKNQLGMVIYLQQEGRGIGLANKIAAYSLQEQGLDTVDANRALGLPDDCREYTSVRNILANLGIKSVQLITNNPRKISELRALGINVTGRIPCLVEAGEFNQGYLEAKRDRMDHMIGEWCYWNHDGEPTQPSSTAHTAGGMGLPQGLTRTPDGRVMISMDSMDDAPALPRLAVDGSSSS